MNNLYIPDAVYPSDNEAEVPLLRLDRQAEVCEIPFVCFGEQKRTYNMGNRGTLHFYTEDYRFNAIWEHPEKILQHKPAQIVEPNFSMYNEMPVAFAMQAVYKKRFIARAMQDRGVRIFVDLNVSSKFYKLNMLGVPLGWSSFCTRGYSDRINYLEFEYELAKSYAGDNPLLFVIYGGGLECKRFARAHGCVYISPTVTLKAKASKVQSLISENVAYLNEEFRLAQLPTQAESIFEGQLLDFRTTEQLSSKQPNKLHNNETNRHLTTAYLD